MIPYFHIVEPPRVQFKEYIMSQHWNNFCLKDCTGYKVQDIRECEDRACPFYQFRRGGFEKQVEADIYKKLLCETGVME